jgi:hypothetical protein
MPDSVASSFTVFDHVQRDSGLPWFRRDEDKNS